MGYRGHGVETGGLPIEYIRRFLAEFKIPIFIETGTAGGDSILQAYPFFEQCHTIEIVAGRAPEGLPKNIKSYHGDSAKILPELVREYHDEYIFFWLDAHYSEPHESEPDTVECPLLEEIEAIKRYQEAVIMIDDARLFLAPPKWPCDYTRWPSFSAVFNTLCAAFPKHYKTVIDDYIICIPDEMKDVVRYEWWERETQRFPSDSDKLKNASKLVYQNFLKYIDAN